MPALWFVIVPLIIYIPMFLVELYIAFRRIGKPLDKGGEYLQIKLHGEKQNVRLKDYQFSAEFISKPIQEKLAFYTGQGKARSPKQKADDLAKGTILLQKWSDRAREIKYLHTGSSFYKKTYFKATDKEKTVLSVLNSQTDVYKYFNKDCVRGPRNFYFFKNTCIYNKIENE